MSKNKSKAHYKVIRNETYQVEVIFVYGSVKKSIKLINKLNNKLPENLRKNKKELNLLFKDMLLSTGILDRKSPKILWVDSKQVDLEKILSVLVHECNHLTFECHRSRDIVLDFDNQEPFTYLSGFWFKQMAPIILNNYKQKKKC